MGREKKSQLESSRPLWSKPLLYLAAAALGGVMMLPQLDLLFRERRLSAEYGYATYIISPVWVEGSFWIGSFVLIAGTTIAWVVYAQNRHTSRPASRRDASKKKDIPSAVHAIFDFVSLLIPQRLANEELGDALEVINREIAKRRSRWRIWLAVGTTLFWITINSLRWARGAFRGRRRFR